MAHLAHRGSNHLEAAEAAEVAAMLMLDAAKEVVVLVVLRPRWLRVISPSLLQM